MLKCVMNDKINKKSCIVVYKIFRVEILKLCLDR